MIRVTTWNPDTCGCVIEMEWDDTEIPRTHRVKSVKLCAAHSGDTLTVFDTVLEENRRKNKVLPIVQGVVASVTPDALLWWFDANRTLNMSFVGITLSEVQKTQVKVALDTILGTGKVSIK